MRTIVIAALIAIGIPQIALAAQASASGQPVKAIGDAQRGEALVTRWCASCHRLGNDGTATDQAPTIPWIAGQVHNDPGYIRTFLTHPHAPMPPLDLDRGEIEDVIVYFGERGAR